MPVFLKEKLTLTGVLGFLLCLAGKKNYKDVLAQLDDDGIIQIQTSNGKKRRAGTFPDNIMVTFPER